MPQPEFLAWMEFYKLHPFDDYARFYRPAALIAHQASVPRSLPSEETLGDLLAFLERRKAPEDDGYSDADLATMKAFGVKPPRRP